MSRLTLKISGNKRKILIWCCMSIVIPTKWDSLFCFLKIMVFIFIFRNDKAGLYNAVESSLSKNSVVTLLDINYLSGGSARALHSFCDSDPTGGEDPTMAPYVHTAVLSTLQGPTLMLSKKLYIFNSNI